MEVDDLARWRDQISEGSRRPSSCMSARMRIRSERSELSCDHVAARAARGGGGPARSKSAPCDVVARRALLRRNVRSRQESMARRHDSTKWAHDDRRCDGVVATGVDVRPRAI
jgi:hypothetical protein